MRTLLLAVTLLAAAPALADETTGTILAYDRLASRVVLNDRTVWELGTTLVPADLAAGDVVTIAYNSAGDSGVGKITTLTRKE